MYFPSPVRSEGGAGLSSLPGVMLFGGNGFAQKMFFSPIFCATLLKSRCLLDSVIGGP